MDEIELEEIDDMCCIICMNDITNEFSIEKEIMEIHENSVAQEEDKDEYDEVREDEIEPFDVPRGACSIM